MPLAANPLIEVRPGLMIWTIVCFLITLYVLRRYAFGPIQKLIDQAQTQAEEILGDARRVADANQRRMREELEADRQRRLEETRRQIEAETRRALEQIRVEVVDLSLLAASKVTRKALDEEDHRRLIEEAVGELDFSVLESER